MPSSAAISLQVLDPSQGPTIVVHGGAGGHSSRWGQPGFEAERYEAGVRASLEAGRAVLLDGGDALDAVIAAVRIFEEDPLFNAAVGASLTTAETAELDASVMTGDGSGGGVTICRVARQPILAARAVMERTPHSVLADPPAQLLESFGLETCDPSVFVTQHRLDDLRAQPKGMASLPGHGTVGAVAVDASGKVAAATSTGGITGKWPGRVGDTPIFGAGTWADDRSVAVSTTGQGEYFLRGSIAKEIADRVEFGGASLADAASGTIQRRLSDLDAYGGVIVVAPTGEAVLAFNSESMFRGWARAGLLEAWV